MGLSHRLLRQGLIPRVSPRRTVVRDAWSDEANAFTQDVGSTALDASNLMMALSGNVQAAAQPLLDNARAVFLLENVLQDRGLSRVCLSPEPPVQPAIGASP